MSLTTRPPSADGSQASPIAVVAGPDTPPRFIYVTDRPGGATSLPVGVHEQLWIEPTREKGKRDVLTINAPSGAGKSTLAFAFAKRWRAIHGKSRPIILISGLEEDTSLPTNDATGIKRLSVQSLVERPLTLAEFEGGPSLWIVDDAETIRADKAQDAALQAAVNMLLTQGRHVQASCVVCAHLLTDGARTRLLHHESTVAVVFPHGASAMQTDYFLRRYVGADRAQSQRIRKTPARWVAIKKSYPPVVMSNAGVWMLNGDDDTEHKGTSSRR